MASMVVACCFNVCDHVTPVNVEDGAETSFEEIDVITVGDIDPRAVEESGDDPLDPDHQAFVVPNRLAQFAKRTICT